METHSKKRRIERAGFPNLVIRDLPNGVRCYIFNNELPPGTGSISLIVNAGMLCEEENETGTAHLLEHMLIRAAADSIDSEFLGRIRSHTGHETTQTHTQFNFVIKKDDELLAALKMFSLIVNQELAITEAHFEDEREVVDMEYNAAIEKNIQANKTHFISIVEGHASLKMCLDNLDKIDLAMLNSFYKKWYIPSRMALLAIGKFDIEVLQYYCGVKNPGMTTPLMARSNNWTLGLIIRNADVNSNCLVIRCERESDPLKALGRQLLVMAIHERLQSAIRASTLAYRQHLRSDTFIVLSSDGSLKELVREFLRLKKWGLTSSEKERQFSKIKEDMTRSLFLYDQDENYRTNELQKKILDHFLYDDEITAPDSVAKLIEDKSSVLGFASDCLEFLDIYQSKIYDEGESFTSLKELIEECEKQLNPWIDTDTGMVFDEIPENRAVLSVNHMNDLGMHEFVLDNGMRVLLGSSSLPHSCSMRGFAYGGLLQLDKAEYVSSWFALELVNNLPSFPLKPYLEEFEMKLEVEDYIRSFHAIFDSSALASVLKLVQGLFCNKPDPADTEELYEAINSVQRQRHKSDVAFEYASGRPSWQRIPKRDSVVSGKKALKFFSECFLDPSQFTLVICGDFPIEKATSLSQVYLESIPRQHSEIFPSDRKKLNTFLIKAPQQVVRRYWRAHGGRHGPSRAEGVRFVAGFVKVTGITEYLSMKYRV
ncbi:hypothetical protein RND81_08G230700 [Saponaria officinalis]|uniref:Peptidase M16 N-terminal domain-containing protein n=1 Tax=Saponaria officinalis TaxID=3572 RepID=A0AAW1JB86_SAPOF